MADFSDLNTLAGAGTASRVSNPDQLARDYLGVGVRQQLPYRQAGWMGAISGLTQRAQASPEMLGDLVNPQLQEMAQQILASNRLLGRTFGPYGGNQAPARQGAAIAQQPWQSTFVNPTTQAGQNLAAFASNTGFSVPQGRVSTETRQGPVNIANIARGFQNLFQAGAGLYGGMQNLNAPKPDMTPYSYDVNRATALSSPMMTMPNWGTMSTPPPIVW